MKKYSTIIIGSGASGSMCALNIKNKSVAIIDNQAKPFKKILVTGNGKCNLTNTNYNKFSYNTDISSFLSRFDYKQTLKLFESLGLETKVDKEGRVYPLTAMAKSVQDVVLNKLEKYVDFYMQHMVVEIKKQNHTFVVKTDKEIFEAKNLVVATGGNSKEILNMLGVDYKDFVPSLVSLKCSNVNNLNGIRVSDVGVSVNINGSVYSEIGEVLFKEQGLSGIVIFNISSLLARKGNFKTKVSIDLLPNFTKDELIKKIAKRKSLNVNLDKIFVGMFNNALANEILKQAKVNTNINSLKASDDIIAKIVGAIKNLSFDVIDYYENNQVYSGGIRLTDLDNNLMNKKINGLYFIGEICDVDGMCGGYNLQWAWTSGKIVGDSLC